MLVHVRPERMFDADYAAPLALALETAAGDGHERRVRGGDRLQVLDHGYVELIDFLGKDEDFVRAARMSTGKGFLGWDPSPENPRGDATLLEFLWRKRHSTPFEFGNLVFEVKAPIVVIWEWVRHRTLGFNVESGRYGQLADEHYVPPPERVRFQSVENKQGSGEVVPADLAELFRMGLVEQQEEVYEFYDLLANGHGISLELARLNCPFSRYSKFRVTGNVRNWFAFLLLRDHPAAQKEIQEFARAVGAFLQALFPRTYGLWEEFDKYGASLGRTELTVLRRLAQGLEGVAEEYAREEGLSGRRLREFLALLK